VTRATTCHNQIPVGAGNTHKRLRLQQGIHFGLTFSSFRENREKVHQANELHGFTENEVGSER
jgi:hypothetical protein